MTLYSEIEEDRAEGAGPLIPIMDLGDLFLNDYIPVGGDSLSPKLPSAPIEIVWNAESKLLQNKYTVSRETLYEEYWYVSGINETMRNHLKYVVEFAIKNLPGGDLDSSSVVLDIASNDGTLLRNYREKGYAAKTVGYDPAINLMTDAQFMVDEHYPICFDSHHYHNQGFEPARIITACAVVYHLPQPIAFLREVEECLADDGVFVCEFSYLPSMMKNNAYDSLGHEHLTHLSLMSFEKMLHVAGLSIVHSQLGDINAGTILLAITKEASKITNVASEKTLDHWRTVEDTMGLGEVKVYLDWAESAAKARGKLLSLLESIHRAGDKVFVYGASTKGSILLQWSGIKYPLIQRAVERHPEKIGRTMVGTEIPIISEESARNIHPEYMLVLPWHFRDEFLSREREYLEAGGNFIFPLPVLSVVGS